MRQAERNRKGEAGFLTVLLAPECRHEQDLEEKVSCLVDSLARCVPGAALWISYRALDNYSINSELCNPADKVNPFGKVYFPRVKQRLRDN